LSDNSAGGNTQLEVHLRLVRRGIRWRFLAYPLKVKAIAESRIKTDKISADTLVDFSAPACSREPMLLVSRQGPSRMF